MNSKLLRVEVKFIVNIPADDVDGTSDMDHAAIRAVQVGIENAMNIDDMCDRLGYEWRIL